ncbi:MAG: hypothetical protein J6Y65_00260, partial [Eggerthellaceae bacterium]|nr:hypothetical protein [Eggerthellaceae bacterium]
YSYLCADYKRKDMDISREILQFLHYHPLSSRDEIARGTAFEGSDATMKRLLASRNLYLSTVAAKREGRAWYKNAAVLLGGVMGTIINRKKYLARLVSRCEEKPFDECAYVGQLFNLNGIKSVFAKEMFGITQEHAFGSFVVNVPHDALGYLELEYGDWRRMPPVEKRVAKHDFIELSFGKSYLD